MKKLLYNIYFKDRDLGLFATLITIFVLIFSIIKIVSLFSVQDAIYTGVVIGLCGPFLTLIILIFIANQNMPDDTKTIQKLCQDYDVGPSQVLLLNDNAIITLDDGTKLHVEATPPHINTRKIVH